MTATCCCTIFGGWGQNGCSSLYLPPKP